MGARLLRALTLTLLLVCLGMQQISGQACTGSLGDPILRETFGSGPGNGPALPAGTTNLQYLDTTCPNDGQYAIVSYTSKCFQNTWFAATDHTGDPNGYFMLINASFAPDDFYVRKVDGLCDGTVYQFSAYVMNILNKPEGINPNITFTIEKTDGTVLATYVTLDIQRTSVALWQYFGFYFTTPAGVSSVILRMHNNAKGGNGNDLGLDDITFRPAGPAIMLTAPGASAGVINIDTSAILRITASAEACYVSTAYQWQQSTDGSNWQDISGETGTIYTRPAGSTGTYYYRVRVAESGNISKTSCGVVSETIRVIAGPPTPAAALKATVPTAFTPNNDAINDTWLIPALAAYPSCRVDVFNRYGQPVFHSIGYSNPWDGRYNTQPLPVGTYYYVIDIGSGTTVSGPVTILR